jgi:flagellar M-ring protein FliF
MPPFLQKYLDQIKSIFNKLNKVQKIIIAGSAVFLFIILGFLFTVSSDKPKVLLFEDLPQEEFAEITNSLESARYDFSTSGGDTIYVSVKERNLIMQMLAQDRLLPQEAEGWKLLDMKDWAETKFDKDKKMQRIIRGALIKSIESLRKVKKAVVNIAVPPTELFENNISPVKAAVILHLIPGAEGLSKKEVNGIITIVQRTVPKLKRENISIADSDGRILSDPLHDIENEKELEMKIVKMKLAIQEQERVKKLIDIRETLDIFYPDRYEIFRLDLEVNWDIEKYIEETYSPIVKVKDNKNTPYDETQTQDSLPISDQEVLEKFIGRGVTPDGPAGTEPNIPPGYKDTDYQKALYEKTKKTKNHAINKKNSDVKKQPWKIKKITLAVVFDGIWVKKGEKEDASGYIREYTAIADKDLKKIKNLLSTSIGFEKVRGDGISVETIQRDRTAEFAAEDAALKKKRLIRNILLASLITILTLFIAIILWRAIKKEIERRRRKREEELARQQQLMREAALRVAEDEGAEYELSADEKARREMLENAINLARDKPEDVALLLRTWLAEE